MSIESLYTLNPWVMSTFKFKVKGNLWGVSNTIKESLMCLNKSLIKSILNDQRRFLARIPHHLSHAPDIHWIDLWLDLALSSSARSDAQRMDPFKDSKIQKLGARTVEERRKRRLTIGNSWMNSKSDLTQDYLPVIKAWLLVNVLLLSFAQPQALMLIQIRH